MARRKKKGAGADSAAMATGAADVEADADAGVDTAVARGELSQPDSRAEAAAVAANADADADAAAACGEVSQPDLRVEAAVVAADTDADAHAHADAAVARDELSQPDSPVEAASVVAFADADADAAVARGEVSQPDSRVEAAVVAAGADADADADAVVARDELSQQDSRVALAFHGEAESASAPVETPAELDKAQDAEVSRHEAIAPDEVNATAALAREQASLLVDAAEETTPSVGRLDSALPMEDVAGTVGETNAAALCSDHLDSVLQSGNAAVVEEDSAPATLNTATGPEERHDVAAAASSKAPEIAQFRDASKDNTPSPTADMKRELAARAAVARAAATALAKTPADDAVDGKATPDSKQRSDVSVMEQRLDLGATTVPSLPLHEAEEASTIGIQASGLVAEDGESAVSRSVDDCPSISGIKGDAVADAAAAVAQAKDANVAAISESKAAANATGGPQRPELVFGPAVRSDAAVYTAQSEPKAAPKPRQQPTRGRAPPPSRQPRQAEPPRRQAEPARPGEGLAAAASAPATAPPGLPAWVPVAQRRAASRTRSGDRPLREVGIEDDELSVSPAAPATKMSLGLAMDGMDSGLYEYHNYHIFGVPGCSFHVARPPEERVQCLISRAVTPVQLHVYEVGHNRAVQRINAMTKNFLEVGGIFHGAIEVFDHEWSFGNTRANVTGIFVSSPKKCPMHTYRESMYLGDCRKSPFEVHSILEKMKSEWMGPSYDLLERNCCTFSDSFARKLGVGPIPPWVNRLAKVGARLRHAGEELHEDVRMGVHSLHALEESAHEELSQVMERLRSRRHRPPVADGTAFEGVSCGQECSLQ